MRIPVVQTGTVAITAAGVMAALLIGGLAYRKVRQRRIAQALTMDTPGYWE